MIYSAIYNSPIGDLSLIFDSEDVIYSLQFGKNENLPKSLLKKSIKIETSQLSVKIKNALDAYFAGEKNAFENLNLVYEGTDFQVRAWNELRKIPYGKVISYKEQCFGAGSPKGFRPIGQANNKNPIAIIIPCHRVIGSNGKMVGFGGGIDIKEKLLSFEAKNLN